MAQSLRFLATPRSLRFAAAAAVAGALTVAGAQDASACGGFFCGRQPVDQTAERILFEVGQDSVTMTTQISFSGDAEDFAWILPLSETPDPNSLSVDFPQAALNALDVNTGPQFLPPDDPACYDYVTCAACAGPGLALDNAESASPSVNVEIRAVVGDYEVAVVSSEDPQALIDWLLENGYRITNPMRPYIERYTEEGLKFLALKLTETAGVEDIKPFRFTLPGTTPTIPLRMTALAAEPEMSIVVFVLGAQRFEGKNWPNLEIPDEQIRFSFSFPLQTNWTKLVAEHVDDAGGQGWVTELAGASEPYAALIRNQIEGGFLASDVAEAATQLLASLEAHPYVTRLYTRLSAEEMSSDPVLGLSAGGDVDNEHQLSRVVDGVDQCPTSGPVSTDPCDFSTCGAGGFCRAVPLSAMGMSGAPAAQVAGCACLPGATARPTFAPDGSPTVICQDGRLSFLNPGDRETDSAEALPDACAGFSCGRNGQCVAMNMTPTCVCDQGFVAVSTAAAGGAPRGLSCVRPPELVPASFYEGRLPALPADLPGGRDVAITEPDPMPQSDDVGNGDPTTPDPVTSQSPDTFPMPRANPELAAVRSSSSRGCSIEGTAPVSRSAPWLIALALGALGSRRARRARG